MKMRVPDESGALVFCPLAGSTASLPPRRAPERRDVTALAVWRPEPPHTCSLTAGLTQTAGPAGYGGSPLQKEGASAVVLGGPYPESLGPRSPGSLEIVPAIYKAGEWGLVQVVAQNL